MFLNKCFCGNDAMMVMDSGRRRKVVCVKFVCPASTAWCETPEQAASLWNFTTAPSDGKAATAEAGEGEPVVWQHRHRILLAVRPDGVETWSEWCGWMDGRNTRLHKRTRETEERALYARPAPLSAQLSNELVEALKAALYRFATGQGDFMEARRLLGDYALSQPPATDIWRRRYYDYAGSYGPGPEFAEDDGDKPQ